MGAWPGQRATGVAFIRGIPLPAHTPAPPRMATFLPALRGAGTPGLRRVVKIGAEMSVGADIRASGGGSDPNPAGLLVANSAPGTGLILFRRATPSRRSGSARCPPPGLRRTMPRRCWRRSGRARCCPSTVKAGSAGLGLSGHRLGQNAGGPAAGRDWPAAGRAGRRSMRPEHARPDRASDWARVEAADKTAGLELVTEVEAVPGGAIRARHTLTNTGREPYVVDSLEVVFPLPGGSGKSSTSPAGRRRNGCRSAIRSATDCGCAKAAAVIPAMTPPPWWSSACPALPSAAARPTGCTSPGAATPSTASNAYRPAGSNGSNGKREPGPPSAAASSCYPARSPWPRASPTPRPGSTSRPPGPVWTAWRPSFTATCARCPRTRARPGRSTSTSGRPSTSATTSPS